MTLPSFEAMLGAEPALGFVETPRQIVDLMVNKLFQHRTPSRTSRVLDPGCGTGAFIDGILRWCGGHAVEIPRIVGIEADHTRANEAVDRFAGIDAVSIRQGDFLALQAERFDFVIGNPPYVQISHISPAFRALYRQNYASASGRFDLYMPGVVIAAMSRTFAIPKSITMAKPSASSMMFAGFTSR